MLEKQFEAKGVFRAECVGGTGDGGGENEGATGIHGLFEACCNSQLKLNYQLPRTLDPHEGGH